MSNAGFEKMYPALLEDCLQEVGDLLGETLKLDSQAFDQGSLGEVLLPRKKKTAVAGFRPKGEDRDQVHLFMDLDGAIELAGKLIMLPADEIKASQKQAKLEGEMEDAFSEITNIITGVINSTWHDCLPDKKLHFVRGDLMVFGPKDDGPDMPDGRQSVLSGRIVLNDKSLGAFQFFFPHSLGAGAEEDQAEKKADVSQEQKPAKESIKTQTASPGPKPGPKPEPEPEPVLASEVDSGQSSEPAEPAAEDGAMDQKAIDEILIQALDPAAEELGALLGDEVFFEESMAGIRQKTELLSKTRGKQVLTRIKGTGDRQGQAFMLIPLKDAVYFGGLLLMMPPESITQIVKQGKFEGEVADAFGEIANILVGCYSNEFKAGLNFNLKLQKDAVETLVPSQVDPASDRPFAEDQYYIVSARIKMAEKVYGPLELLFPPGLLGLSKSLEKAPETADESKSAQGQKPVQRQKTDTDQVQDTRDHEDAESEKTPVRIISVIGGDPDQLELIEQSIAKEDASLAVYPMDTDFKQEFLGKNPDCVFLFINKVNDQGLSKAIKVRSALGKNCPLIVGGPQWTKSLVLKARKYGVSDILVTPAGKDVIIKKFRKHL